MRTIIVCIAVCTAVAYSQFSLQTENIGGAKNSSQQNTFRATLKKNNAPVATIERAIPFDVPFPSVHLNESTGMFILNYAFDGFVEAYNSSGKKMWEQNFFKEMKPNYERTITVAVGNTSIAFLTSDVTLSNAVVRRFSLAGTQEWETQLPHSLGYEVALSQDEQLIVAGSYFVLEDEVRNSATVVNAKGGIVGSADILFRSAAFNASGSMLALASEREVVLYDIKTKRETARAAKKTEGVISNLLWRGAELFVQESAVRTTPEHQFYFADPTLIKYTSSLTEVSRTVYPVERFKRSTLNTVSDSIVLTCDERAIITTR